MPDIPFCIKEAKKTLSSSFASENSSISFQKSNPSKEEEEMKENHIQSDDSDNDALIINEEEVDHEETVKTAIPPPPPLLLRRQPLNQLSKLTMGIPTPPLDNPPPSPPYPYMKHQNPFMFQMQQQQPQEQQQQQQQDPHPQRPMDLPQQQQQQQRDPRPQRPMDLPQQQQQKQRDPRLLPHRLVPRPWCPQRPMDLPVPAFTHGDPPPSICYRNSQTIASPDNLPGYQPPTRPPPPSYPEAITTAATAAIAKAAAAAVAVAARAAVDDDAGSVCDHIRKTRKTKRNKALEKKEILKRNKRAIRFVNSNKMGTAKARLETFRKKCFPFPEMSENLANSGFYYEGKGDEVRCFMCSSTQHNWGCGDEEKNPWKYHQLFGKKTPYSKGRTSVKACCYYNLMFAPHAEQPSEKKIKKSALIEIDETDPSFTFSRMLTFKNDAKWTNEKKLVKELSDAGLILNDEGEVSCAECLVTLTPDQYDDPLTWHKVKSPSCRWIETRMV